MPSRVSWFAVVLLGSVAVTAHADGHRLTSMTASGEATITSIVDTASGEVDGTPRPKPTKASVSVRMLRKGVVALTATGPHLNCNLFGSLKVSTDRKVRLLSQRCVARGGDKSTVTGELLVMPRRRMVMTVKIVTATQTIEETWRMKF